MCRLGKLYARKDTLKHHIKAFHAMEVVEHDHICPGDSIDTGSNSEYGPRTVIVHPPFATEDQIALLEHVFTNARDKRKVGKRCKCGYVLVHPNFECVSWGSSSRC